MRIASKIIGAIATLITVLIIIIACFLFIPRIFGYTPYIVMSGSMAPTISVGSVVYIDNKDTDVEVGDIIAFEGDSGAMVTHRVYATNPDGTYATKGDANDVIDVKPLSQDRIRGTYKRSIPTIGYFLAHLNSKHFTIGGMELPAGPFMLILVLLVANGMAMFLSTMADEEDEESYEEYDDDEEFDEYDDEYDTYDSYDESSYDEDEE